MSDTTPQLTATYFSPTNAPLALASAPLPACPAAAADPSVEEKTAYLGALRRAVAALQERVNAELTARMEEDNRRAAAAAGAGAKGDDGKDKNQVGVDEAAEEENYGEEVQEEEEED
ncbi:hypothetical protein F4780DRAFT_779498 [Xylariomycetidae sp. FL0641]|nr:hypothetical protein F4780DRAFT_779498 [Xylariomycetidae sp. FL0641]